MGNEWKLLIWNVIQFKESFKAKINVPGSLDLIGNSLERNLYSDKKLARNILQSEYTVGDVLIF